MQLKNKVAIITGSARGLARNIALRFAREGACVTLCDIHDCEPVAAEIKALGSEVLTLRTDVTKEVDTLGLAEKTQERFGRIDILVNNAAVFGKQENMEFIKPFDQITAEEWDMVMSVNLKGMFLCCKAVAPFMKKQGQGKIVNMSSSTAFSGAPVFLHYTTSKGGVISMTRALARALGEYNINVNAVAPGLTLTEASQSLSTPEEYQKIVNTFIIKRLIKPADIAAAVLFLSSAEADQITGEVLGVNAGEYLH